MEWKLFKITPQHKMCCSDCERMTNPPAQKVGDARDHHIFRSSLIKEISGNEQIVHKLYNEIKQSSNPFKDFDALFCKYFKTGKTENDLLYMSIYERIFLRCIRRALGPAGSAMDDYPRYHLHEGATFDAHLNVGIVGISTDKRNGRDIPRRTDISVQCSNREFSAFSDAVFHCFSTPMSRISHQILVRYLNSKIEQMFILTKEDPIFSHGWRNTAYCYLQHIKNSLESELISIQDQRIQIHELVGNSGIGKSRAVSNLASIVRALVPFIPSGDIVYTRANDYWWNGYCGQPIILYDDFTHIKKKMKFDLVFELIAIASGTFRNPPMAFAKNMKFTSLLGIVTSNIPVLTTVREADTISAIKRRVSSKQWESTPGSRNSDNSMSFNGLLLNSIISDCSVFSLFSETHDIIQSECTYQFKINNAQYDYYDDEESMDPIGPTTTVLISSVPESYSAPCVVVVAPKERVISTDQSKIDHAQVNYKSTEEPMVSRKFTTHAPLPDDSSTSMKLLSFMSTWTQ